MRKRCCVWMCMLSMLAIFQSNAQELQNCLGIKGGISIPNLTAPGSANPLSTGYSSRLGPDAAIFWEQAVTGSFSIVPGIEYASEGGKKNGFQPFPFPQEYAGFFPPGQVPTYLYANFSNEIKLDYVMLHVLAKFNWQLGPSSAFTMYAEGGPFGAYLISAKDVTGGSSVIYADEQKQQPLIATAIPFNNKMDILDEAHKGNFGFTADVGLTYNLTNSKIFVEAGGNYGLLNIQKDAANGKNGIGALIGRVGYALSFGLRY